MHNGPVRLIAVGLLAVTLSVISPDSFAANRGTPKPAKIYNSPCQVFDAYRKAADSQDWRTEFYCLTSELREKEVFEVLLNLGAFASELEVRSLCKKCRVDADGIGTEYDKRYKAKHGIDLAQWRAEHEKRAQKSIAKPEADKAKHPAPKTSGDAISFVGPDAEPPEPPYDEELLRQVVKEWIADKAGFFVEAQKAASRGNHFYLTGHGDLRHVTIKADTATGETYFYGHRFDKETGQTEYECGESGYAKFHFRKTRFGWLIERFEDIPELSSDR